MISEVTWCDSFLQLPMILPPFPRHSWRPLPVGFVSIPESAHMLYGHPQEGICTHYGWRKDGSDTGPRDMFSVCLPDTVTIVPVLVTEEELKKCGVKVSGNALPTICMQASLHTSDSLQCAHGPVKLNEDPRDAAERILLETFGLTVKEQDYFASLVHQPDPRVESLNYTFIMRGLALKQDATSTGGSESDNSSSKPKPSKKMKPSFLLKHPSEVFSLVGNGKLVGECEFFRRLILAHGYANVGPSFGINVTKSAQSYSILEECVTGWDGHRGTPPPVRSVK